MKKIKGIEALVRMRDVCKDPKAHFMMVHQTWNRKTRTSDGPRKVLKARLRPRLPQEKFAVSTELYLPYTDLAEPEALQRLNRFCRKRLIKFVAFPPDYETMEVVWIY